MEHRSDATRSRLYQGEGGPRLAESGGFSPADAALHTRREFLRLAGFTVAGATLAGCRRAPVEYSLAPLVQPEELVPGKSYEYATTCGGCTAGCGVLAKVRDGRPIKLEGNPQHPLSRGGLCAAGQASLLGLYDRQRLQGPFWAGQPVSWSEVDRDVRARFDEVRKQDRAVRFLTGSLLGPTARAWLTRWLGSFTDARHVVYDANSSSAILAAHARTHGGRLLPRYRLERAQTIVSFEADFLGRWISPVEFTGAYGAGRRLEGASSKPLYHVQFESRLSLTGTKADDRITLAPGEIGLVLSHLARRLGDKAGVPLRAELENAPVADGFLDRLADRLWQSRKASVVLCGTQDVEHQVLCNHLNQLLDNYGATVDLDAPSYQQQGDDAELENLLREIEAGKVAAVCVYGCNPVHDLPGGESLAQALSRVPLLVSFAERLDETARLAHCVCPVPHYLESWNDAETVGGLVSVYQPVIAALGQGRPLIETLAAWNGEPHDALKLIRAHWEREVFPRWNGGGSFQEFWDHCIHDGFAQVAPSDSTVQPFEANAVQAVSLARRTPQGTFSLILYSKVGMPDASHAYNPWLHELPDPVTKATWDNYASLSPATATRLGVGHGDVVRIEAQTAEGRSLTLELPVVPQPGQHDEVVAVALGYGSRLSDRFARIGPDWLDAAPTVGADGLVGKNAAGWLTWESGNLHRVRDGVRVVKTGRTQPLAVSQSYDLLSVPPHLALPGQERRPIIRDLALADYQRLVTPPKTSNASGERDAPEHEAPHADLWPDDHPAPGPRWGMAIDLNACTGCSACVIACQAENNVPVVGKDEVRRHREMHWLRIDRYYSEHGGGPDVAHQPMLCQHCGNAPCEAVCPVLATVHSDDGLNQQVYNRCVGTRYCANNCPYKVRRFNWFEYRHDDILQDLVLNPDVTVRSRGVMEKCTFCVQRIEEARADAGGRDQPIRDGAIQTACQQSCPAGAIVFGDLNDPQSEVSRLTALPRSYRVLEELNVRPAVSYLAVVRNRPSDEESHG